MKKIILLLSTAAFATLTVTAPAADKKPARNEKPEKGGKKEKEAVRNNFTFTLEGAKDESVADIAKTAISGIKDLKIDEWTKGEKGYEAKVSTPAPRFSRGDLAKVLKDSKELKDEKDLKISDFKAVRAEKDDKKDEKKDDKKDEKKDDKKDMKPEDKKPEAKPEAKSDAK